jgi:hypothetical protein
LRFLQAPPLVAAYVCPRGVFAIVVRRAGGGVEIEQVLDRDIHLESASVAADHLVGLLKSSGIDRATLSLSLRGFGVVHHVLQLPPAPDALIAPIIEREVRRLEPELGDCVVGWTPLPALDAGATEVPQRSLLTAAAPQETVSAFEQRLRNAGFRVSHVTALAVAMQRLVEEFAEEGGTVALVAPLPDGAFMGFSLKGALRLVVEPPLPKGTEHDSAALAEELELGVMFVRQQFRGAQLERIALVGTDDAIADTETVLAEKMHVPAQQLGVPGLSAAGYAALGALLDGQSPRPCSLGGDSRNRGAATAKTAMQTASVAALFVLAVLGVWTVTETVRARQAANSLRAARLQIAQDSFGLAPIRATADHRRLVSEAIEAAQVLASDRIALQEMLAGIAAAVRAPVRLDTMQLERSSLGGWLVVLGGSVRETTNAQAIQSLHDVYRELPNRLSVDSLHLDSLAYADSGATDARSTLVRFQFSFAVPARRRD